MKTDLASGMRLSTCSRVRVQYVEDISRFSLLLQMQDKHCSFVTLKMSQKASELILINYINIIFFSTRYVIF